MKNLIDVILRLNKYVLPRIDIISNAESTTKQAQLYKQIVEGKIKTEEQAAVFLSTKEKMLGTSKFSNFKKEFQERVLNTLLFIDPDHPDFDDFEKDRYSQYKEWVAIQHIYANQQGSIATGMAEKLIEKVIEIEYVELAVIILSRLKAYFALAGDNNRRIYYQDLFNTNKTWLDEEYKAKEYQETLLVQYAKSGQYKPQNSELAESYFNELCPLLNNNPNTAFNFCVRIIELYIFSTKNDYAGVLDVCNRALDFFEAKKLISKRVLSVFHEQKMVALMYLIKYDEGIENIQKALAMRVEGTFNWFKAQESKMFLLFRMAHYAEAYQLYTIIIAHREFKTLTGLNKEIWDIFNGFIHLIYHLNRKLIFLDTSEAKEFKIEFRLSTFKNNIPTAEHDKKGFDLVRLALEICLALVDKKTNSSKDKDSIFDHPEGLQKYFVRYTEKESLTRRFGLFGKMLIEIYNHPNDLHEVRRETNTLLFELRSTIIAPYEMMYRMEVIELEDLWETMLEHIFEAEPSIEISL